jgi:hypothetical protein
MGSSGRVTSYRSRGPEFGSQVYQIFWEIAVVIWCHIIWLAGFRRTCCKTFRGKLVAAGSSGTSVCIYKLQCLIPQKTIILIFITKRNALSQMFSLLLLIYFTNTVLQYYICSTDNITYLQLVHSTLSFRCYDNVAYAPPPFFLSLSLSLSHERTR